MVDFENNIKNIWNNLSRAQNQVGEFVLIVQSLKNKEYLFDGDEQLRRENSNVRPVEFMKSLLNIPSFIEGTCSIKEEYKKTKESDFLSYP